MAVDQPTSDNRLPRSNRAKKPPRLEITERDIEFLRALLQYRFLTIEQYQWLFPEASPQKLQTRLRLMYHHKLMDRETLKISRTASVLVYSLAEVGARMIAEEEGMSREDVPWQRHMNRAKSEFLNHHLAINHVVVSLSSALEQATKQGQVTKFRIIKSTPKGNRITVTMRDADGRRKDASVIPDAVMAVIFTAGKYELFFIEVDRGTTSSSRWKEKIAVYREYQRSNKVLEKYQKRGFVLLTATTGDKRIDTLAKATVAIGGQRGYWFTRLDQISPSTCLEKQWVRASELYQRRNEQVLRLSSASEPQLVSILDSFRR